ncbi:MAG TPA: tRNA pseudouridine(13) synthase TruD [Gammaproteobacteria bacterium]|nr:tRNA pseudouridine(13) synthase TruD [Gammaproteobacteria bacterium]
MDNASARPSPCLPDWPRALGAPQASAQLRACPEDFCVDELRDGEPDGEGEHLLLHIRKRNRNTDEVARALARCAGVRARNVSYCGLKDRVAVTTQWFSLWLPGKPDPDWSPILDENLVLLGQARTRRKLQRGGLRGNRFTLLLREVQGDREALEKRLAAVAEHGVPNYFGEQRFGREGSNLAAAEAMFGGRRVKDRHRRGLYLSAARSLLFNEVLAARVRDASWNRALPGEALQLAGSRSFFVANEIDDEIADRLASRDVLPSGPLWGRGELPSMAAARAVEEAVLVSHGDFREGLEKAGLKQERRALRLPVVDLRWRWLDGGQDLQLIFSLPAGCYATAVLREWVIPTM